MIMIHVSSSQVISGGQFDSSVSVWLRRVGADTAPRTRLADELLLSTADLLKSITCLMRARHFLKHWLDDFVSPYFPTSPLREPFLAHHLVLQVKTDIFHLRRGFLVLH